MTRPLLGTVFDTGELRRLVLDRIPPANLVSRGRLTLLALRAQKLRVAAIIVLIAIAAAIQVFVRGRLL
jgi:hypothetical protein